jgi:hypothetical protein
MNMNRYSGPVLFLAMVALSGCGAAETSSPSLTSSLDKTVITGMASKGPINKGTVKVFAVVNGVEGTEPIGQGQTDAVGNFSVDVGSFKGPVVVEVSGSFTDEVSTTTTVTLQSPLRAVFSNASTGKNTVAVTPLTELACKKAKRLGAKLTKASIDDANTTMAAKFKFADIVTTLPVAGGTKVGEKEYAAACGSISQLANTSSTTSGKKLDDSLAEVMSKMENEIENSGDLSTESETELNHAVDDFNSGGKNRSGAEGTHVETHGGGK